MTSVIGIDADTRGVVVAELGSSLYVVTIERRSSKGDILGDYEEKLNDVLRVAGLTGATVYLEGVYMAVRNPKTFQMLAEVQGEIKMVARKHGVEVVTVQPPTWQSAILGLTRPRKALKQASMAAALALAAEFGQELDFDEHQADAACVAVYGRGQELAKTEEGGT